MRLETAAIIAIFVATAAEADADVVPVPRAEIVYHTVFLNDPAKKWDDLPISRPIGDRVLKLIPEGGFFQMIGLDCEQITASGRLRHCKTGLDPNSDALRAVADAAIKDLRIDRLYARSVQGRVRFASIQIRVSKSRVRVTGGPCWAPSCISEPSPPPPPPEVKESSL